jgi:hypothetical protein
MVHYAPKKTCNNTSIINHLGINIFIIFNYSIHLSRSQVRTNLEVMGRGIPPKRLIKNANYIFCIPESFKTNISHQLFDCKITL